MLNLTLMAIPARGKATYPTQSVHRKAKQEVRPTCRPDALS